MSDYRYHERLRLKNFTSFTDTTLEFVPGLNVFVGENGTGKTHALKAMYAWHLHQFRDRQRSSNDQESKIRAEHQVFRDVFHTEEESDLVRLQATSKSAMVEGVYGGREWNCPFFRETPRSMARAEVMVGETPTRPVFIPAVDMLGHTKAFGSIFDEYRIDFDQTYRDIVSLLLSPERRNTTEADEKFLKPLTQKLGGDLILRGERFFVKSKDGEMPAPLLAEGTRKVATLVRLIQTGWLRPGSTLFWDEPETNLNPRWMDEIIEALLALSLQGVQIFLSTHSYVILKEIDLKYRRLSKGQRRDSPVRFFAFRKERGGSRVMWADNFSDLKPNPILDQYDEMLIEDMRLDLDDSTRTVGGDLD